MTTPPLWLPGRPLLDSLEAHALDDLNPPPDLPSDPWAAADILET